METHSAPGKERARQQLLTVQDGADFKSSLSALTSPSSSNSHVPSPLTTDLEVEQDLSITTPATLEDATLLGSQQGQDHDAQPQVQTAPLPPRPSRSGNRRRLVPIPVPQPEILTKPASVSANAAENRRQNVEVPAMARVYPNGNVADFSPWRGKHLEDNISEHTIKSGFQNKPLITNESNTARPAMWAHLKNKGGPATLSSLFVSVLDKRQIAGRIHGPSSFKPPPRVTMSNSRREAFLLELANPAWPMRKLNRSVPHTISGRVLLDQCLSKNIPIPRATWLAKCIGANDFRAFKRKVGTGSTTMASETKWIRDWTIHVEQFLQAVLTGVGESDWRTKVDYALRLSCHLFDEKLLDNDHYLDWILSSVQTASTQYLPMWLLLTQIYWSTLVSSRKRGSRLATALLDHHLRVAGELSNAVAASMLGKLEELIINVVQTKQECLILPGDWLRYRRIMQTLLSKYKDQAISHTLSTIMQRNDQLALLHTTPEFPSADAKIVQILDSLALTLTRNQLADECTKTGMSIEGMVTIVLRWASTKFRHGRYRVYVASRLLQKVLHIFREPEMTLCNIIEHLLKDKTLRHLDLFQVLVELVRADQFSVGRFVQYLVVTGANAESGSANLLTMLRHLPTTKMSDSTKNMYDELLVTNNEHESSFEEIQADIDNCFATVNTVSPDHIKISNIDCSRLTLAQRFDIGHAVRSYMLKMRSPIDKAGNHADDQKVVLSIFLAARNALEAAKELPCLADLIGFHLSSNNQVLLTHITHTLHYNQASLIAIGAMKPLFDQLMTKYEQLRHQQQLLRNFCAALLALSTTLEANAALVAQLTHDVLRCEQLTSIAMCSPVSDNAGETAPLTGNADDDIERVLSSGTTMEISLIQRIFERIMHRIEGPSKAAVAGHLPLADWLSRLRDFNRPAMDQFLRAELSKRLDDPDMLGFVFDCFVPVIVASSCMTLREFADFVRSKETTMPQSHKILISLRLLQILLPDQNLKVGCSAEDAYKFRLEQIIHATASPSTIYDHLQVVLSCDLTQASRSTVAYFRTILQSPQMSSFILTGLSAPDHRQDALLSMISHADSRQLEYISIMVDNLLLPLGSNDPELIDPVHRIESMFTELDDLSLQVVGLELEAIQHDFSLKDSPNHTSQEQMSSIVLRAVSDNQSRNMGVRLQLLSILRKGFKASIAKEAEQQLLSIALDFDTVDRSALIIDKAQFLLTIFERTYVPAVFDSDTSFNVAIVEKLRQGVAIFASAQSEHLSISEGESQTQHVIQLLCILLRLVVIRKNKAPSQKPAFDEFTICSYLFILLQTPQLHLLDGFLQYIFDAATVLVDDLTDEQRSLLARSENWHVNDSRIAFLLGPQPSSGVEAWLGLVTSQSSLGSGGHNITSPPGNMAKSTNQSNAPQSSPTIQQSMQHPARTPLVQQGAANPARPGSNSSNSASSSKTFMPPVQFPLKYWELLPDQGNTGLTNDTAISLSMFSTKKV